MSLAGISKPFREAEFVILGVPYDGTSTYRPGARFAPQVIREASLNIETYSMRSGMDVEDLSIHDLGNLNVVDDLSENLRIVSLVAKEVINAGKKLIMIGGEHTMAMGVIESLSEGTAVLDFDAHMDLRDEYAGRRLSHTTFMRRLIERIGPERIIQIGVRAVCKEELDFAKANKLRYITVKEISKLSLEQTASKIKDLLSPFDNVHLSIDMDVLDPAYAPAVSCPEPDGISTSTLLDLLQGTCDRRFRSFDVSEVVPPYDNGVTAVQAAKIMFEVLCYMKKTER